MEPHESGLHHPYYHHVPNGGAFLPESSDAANAAAAAAAALYPQSLPGKPPSPPPSEIVRKKRGRPRKYLTPEAAAAAKRASSSSSAAFAALSPPSASRKPDRQQQLIGSPPPPSSKRSQFASEADAGQYFMPHIISVQPGEDVAQNIRIFVQQSKREVCILSASGSICNVTLLQPATSGGSITYDGSFDILSLSGSFIRTDHGERSGGLSACLCASNGQIVGGGLAGPLIAMGPVEVIVATFLIDTKKDATAGTKGDPCTTTLASPTSTSVSNMGYRPVIDPPARFAVPGIDDHQNMGGFMIHNQGLHMGSSHSDWRVGPDSSSGLNYDFTGRTGHGTHESPENGDFEHLPD